MLLYYFIVQPTQEDGMREFANDRPLYEARAISLNICAGLQFWSNISVSTILFIMLTRRRKQVNKLDYKTLLLRAKIKV